MSADPGGPGQDYTTVVSGHLFPNEVAGLAAACRKKGLLCHYAVLSADLDTCWERATARGPGRWPLVFEPFAKVHAQFAGLQLDDRHVIDATKSPNAVSDAVLTAYRAGRLTVTDQTI